MTLLQQALETIGGLSRTTKMPCYSWGLPATSCIRGSKLRTNYPDSVCAKCYACRGHYTQPTTIAANKRRLNCIRKASSKPRACVDFTHAFAYVLNYQLAMDAGANDLDHWYFRWFDSGDLQSREHRRIINEIAIRTPDVKHFMPTREDSLVDWEYIPENLTVRLSSDIIDVGILQDIPTSVVISSRDKNPKGYTLCRAEHSPYKCGSCRNCWDPTLQISYLKQ